MLTPGTTPPREAITELGTCGPTWMRGRNSSTPDDAAFDPFPEVAALAVRPACGTVVAAAGTCCAGAAVARQSAMTQATLKATANRGARFWTVLLTGVIRCSPSDELQGVFLLGLVCFTPVRFVGLPAMPPLTFGRQWAT